MHQKGRSVLVALIAILQIVVGVLLLSCGALNMVAVAAGSSSATVTVNDRGKQNTFVYDTREEMEKQTPGYKVFITTGAVVDLLLDVAMLTGAIGLLTYRLWGWWVSLAWAILRVPYHLGTLAYVWFVAMPAANRMVQMVPRDEAHQCSSLVNGNTFYHVFWAFYSLVFSVYPVLILGLLLLPPVWRAFGRSNIRSQDEDGNSRRRRHLDEEDDRRRNERDDY